MAAYTLGGLIGIDVTSSRGTTAVNNPPVPSQAIGSEVELSDGTRWKYVAIPVSTTIIQYGVYGLSTSGGGVAALTSTTGLRGVSIVIAQQAVASDATNIQYIWMLQANPLGTTGYKVRVAASCAIDAKLATTANAGTLDDTTAGTVLRVDGIVLSDSQPAGSSGSRTFRTSSYPLGWGAV